MLSWDFHLQSDPRRERLLPEAGLRAYVADLVLLIRVGVLCGLWRDVAGWAREVSRIEGRLAKVARWNRDAALKRVVLGCELLRTELVAALGGEVRMWAWWVARGEVEAERLFGDEIKGREWVPLLRNAPIAGTFGEETERGVFDRFSLVGVRTGVSGGGRQRRTHSHDIARSRLPRILVWPDELGFRDPADDESLLSEWIPAFTGTFGINEGPPYKTEHPSVGFGLQPLPRCRSSPPCHQSSTTLPQPCPNHGMGAPHLAVICLSWAETMTVEAMMTEKRRARTMNAITTLTHSTLKRGAVLRREARVPGPVEDYKLAKIYLVDDDENILTSVSMFLENEGYEVRTFTDGVSALDVLKNDPPDMAIFDVKMPRMDGIELLRRLRQSSNLPVIFLTSKGDEFDEAIGLNMGADDYIKKPFSQRLLGERIKAVLRRAQLGSVEMPVPGSVEEGDEKVIQRGKLVLDPNRHACSWDGEPVRLTVTEFLILEALARRPGYVKSRDQLMDAAYDDQVYVDDRTIDSHIKRLRKKFRRSDKSFDGIETLYGVGYKYKEA